LADEDHPERVAASKIKEMKEEKTEVEKK